MSYSIQKNTLRSPAAWTVFLALATLLVAGAAPAAADRDDYLDDGYGSYGSGDTAGYDSSYGYVRTLEGSATLIQGDTQDRDGLQVNQPILVGDRIWVAPTGRVEVVLSDRNLLRIDGGSEVVFEALAASPDRDDPTTILRLEQGNVQLVVEPDFLGDDYPRVDTPNATVYASDLGSYRITADEGWSEVVARAGSAEVVTREGSVLLRSGEEAVVEGRDRPRTQVRRASREDSIELWGERLDREARYASQYVDESIAYEAAHLDRYGSWSRIDGRYAWRPRVSVDWRPYWNGRWSFTPLGMTWVSYEPWGWAPYHYGTWDYVPGHGWAWFPGHRFAPAWVYWYWTDHYAGWVPVGYYSRYYWSSYGRYGLRAGVYGYAGGRWDHYGYWNFCETRYFGHRYQYRHVDRGDRFGERHRYAVPKRGIVTTDTRGITRTAVLRSEGIERALSERAARRGGLADVTPFIERRKELPDDVRGRIAVDRGEPSRGDSDIRRPTRLVATDGVPGAGERPSRGDAVRSVRSPRQTVERPGVDRAAPTVSPKPGVVPSRTERSDRPTRAVPATRSPADRPTSERPSVDRPSRVERPEPTRAAPSKDWRERSTAPRREPPARVERKEPPARVERKEPPARVERREPPVRTEQREAPTSWRERSAPSEVRRRPAVRESESDRSTITRRVIEGVRSNDRRSAPSRSEAPSRTERRASPPPPPPATSPRSESSRPSARSSSPSRESYRPSRSESTSRSSRSSRPSRSTRSSSPPPRTRSSARPSTSTRSRSSAPSRSGARSAPSRPSKPPAASRSTSRPSRSEARSSRPSRSSSRATSSRSAPSRSRGKARKPPTS